MNLNTKMMLLFNLVFISSVFCSGVTGLSASVQIQKNTQPENAFSIEWIGSFSSDKDFTKKEGVISGLLKLIAGPRKIRLNKPVAVITTSSNLLEILDQGRMSLIQIDRAGADFNEVHSFPSVVSVCKDEKDNLFFTDSQLNKVFVFKKNENLPVALKDLPAIERPTGIAFSVKNHSLWVVETKAHRISVLDRHGKLIRRIGKRGKAEGEFNFPTFIWIDQKGLVYVVDSMNFRVQIFNSDGTFISAFGQPGDATGYLGRPKGIASDSYGNIYIADALFHTVQIFNKDGQFLSYFGGQGQVNGKFWMPMGIYIDNQNNIFIADSYNARIQMFRVTRKESNAR